MDVVQTEKRDNLDLLLTRKQKKLITCNYKSCEDDASCSCDSFQTPEVHYMCLSPNIATYPGKAGGLKLAETIFYGDHNRETILTGSQPIRFVSISEMCTNFSEKMIPENESEGTRRNEIELTLRNTLAVSGANEDGLMVKEGS
ncbi:hypothetical protein V6N13_129862 [Hibiscus sabdariffa]